MSAANPGMSFDDQFGSSVGLMCKMTAWSTWKTGNPIQRPNDCVRSQVQQINVLAKSEMPNARVLLHDQALRENPAESDMATGMDRITKLFFKQGTLQRPRKHHRKNTLECALS